MASVLKRVLVAGLIVAVAGILAVAATLWWHSRDLPDLISLDDYLPPQTTRVISADGVELAAFATEQRTVVPLAGIPRVVRDAVLAAEDADFYRHEGLDYAGMVRALLVMLKQGGRVTQGASTITQQVVKTFLLSPERTIRRKVKEIILARRLERNLSKDDILTLYLNQIYFGHGRYGVEEAARFYFGKAAADLAVAEAALLAGLVQSPERLSPLKHPDAAARRRAYVLDQMVKAGTLDAGEAARWRDTPLGTGRHLPDGYGLAPAFVEHVRMELKRMVGDDLLYRGGLVVHTTLDAQRQAAANAAVKAGLRSVDARRRYARPLRKNGKPGAAAPGARIEEGVVTGRSAAPPGWSVTLPGGAPGLLPDAAMARYVSDDRPADGLFAAGDVIRVARVPTAGPAADDAAAGTETAGGAAQARAAAGAPAPAVLRPELGPQAALVSMDPDTRRVVALVGADPFLPDSFNRATQARRQPGSSFKPVVYAAGLNSRQVHPATVVPDTPEVYLLPSGNWTPQNYDRTFRGPIRLREALAHSVNMVAIKLLRDIGVEAAVEFAQDIGVESPLDPVLPLALGASAMRPIELTNVFAVFASGGRTGEPVFLDRVEGPTGGVIWASSGSSRQVLDPAVAYLVTDMLTSVVQEGTAVRARELGRPAAGKTGTTNNHTDAWFSGYVPGLVTTVWVGFDDNRPLGGGEQGSKTALPIWLDYMRAAVTGPPRAFLPPPEGIVVLDIDRQTGLLAPAGLPPERVVAERFLVGATPTEYATLPGEVDAGSFLLDQFGVQGGLPGERPPDLAGASTVPGPVVATTPAPVPPGVGVRTIDAEDLPDR